MEVATQSNGYHHDEDSVPLGTLLGNGAQPSSNGGPIKIDHHVAKHAQQKNSEDSDDEVLAELFHPNNSEVDEEAKLEEEPDEEENGKETESKKAKRAKELSEIRQEKKEFEQTMNNQALTRLKFLLEKTSLYSSFLSQKMIGNQQKPEENGNGTHEAEEEEDGPESGDGQKKRKRGRKKKGESPAKKLSVAAAAAGVPVPQNGNKVAELTNDQLPSRPQPTLISGGTMRGYQLQGVQWMISLYENGLNGILADEMGLGKTVQCLGLLAHLVENGVHGPFLVVAPLSTLSNWLKEASKWCPTVATLMYHGNKEEREHLRNTALKRNNKNFPSIIITSYQIVMNDRKFLSRYQWKYIIVDEGHRIKNLNCKLLQELKTYHSANRLLLTGTPLQNKLSELWSMLNFLLPDIFDDLDSFQSWFDFSEIGDTEGRQKIIAQEEQNQIVSKLHQILRPFLLRRIKEDVALDLPTKHEKIVHTRLTDLQKMYYKAILSKDLTNVLSERAQKQIKNSGSSLQNMLMQLRKCCNHPYLFEWPMDEKGDDIIDEKMISASGKLQLLDRLLPRLYKEGHRVLIFSQMTKMLDILEDYLTLRGRTYCRIDGSTTQPEREQYIHDFNTKDETFCFLLSTRAGGLGINLTSADTVIFYDNDWNPQMDLQAQDRVHRIGQTKPVKVYRLASANSIESKILERQENKMQLERLVIHKGNFHGAQSKSAINTINELETLLKSETVDTNIGFLEEQASDDFLFNWTSKERKK